MSASGSTPFQGRKVFGRQAGATKAGPVGAFVAVKVRAAGDSQAEFHRDRAIARDRDVVVIAVVHLDAVEPRLGPHRDADCRGR